MKILFARSIFKVMGVALLLTTSMFSFTTPSFAAATAAGTAKPARTTITVQKPSTFTSLPSSAGLTVSSFMDKAQKAAVPERLETFAKRTISDLSEHLPFNSWQGATMAFTPLGPGTHSWLVTLEDHSKPLGYLIITSDDVGGYVLSEYGIGSELPYSLAPLEQALVSVSLLQNESRGVSASRPVLPQGSKIEAMYSSISPFFKITVKGQAPIYVHAVTYDVLPSPISNSKSFENTKTSGLAYKNTALNSSASLLPSLVTNTQGEPDPYLNLNWLTTPALTLKNEKEMTQHLLTNSYKSLVFTSAKNNAALGAPFNLTGWQSWSASDHNPSDVIYAAVPLRDQDLTRFIPAQKLIRSGQFHEEQ